MYAFWNFYPRPPRGGRHGFNTTILHHEPFLSTPSARRATAAIPEYYWRKLISIHALREEGDRWILLQLRCSRISIHALREEGDAGRRRSQHSGFYFYPRPPRGGRLSLSMNETSGRSFLSTPSARRATKFSYCRRCGCRISIHALREEGDSRYPNSSHSLLNRIPRPP